MARPRDPERLQKFSRWLRVIAPTKGFDSQRQLAIKAGVNEATVSRIWNATQLPDEFTLAKLATALDVDVKEALRQAGYLVHERLATPADTAGENIGGENELVYKQLKKNLQSAMEENEELKTKISETAAANAMAMIEAAAGIGIEPDDKPIELTNILKIENKLTYMGVSMTEDDIIRTRHVIEMIVMHSKLPKVIPIYPPRPPRDYSKIAKIEDIDPDQVPLPTEFMCRGERINRYEYLQAEGRLPTDEDWKNLVYNYKYHPPK